MKKVLAAVLAVAMAASMSAVAFATDHSFDSNTTIIAGDGKTNNGSTTIPMGKEKSFLVSAGENEFINEDLSSEQIAYLMENGIFSADVIVTSGKANLNSNPTLKVVGDQAVMKIKFKDTWGVEDKEVKLKTRFTAKKTFYAIEEQLYRVSFTDGGNTVYMKKNYTKDALPKPEDVTSDLKNAAEFSKEDAERIRDILNKHTSGGNIEEATNAHYYSDKKVGDYYTEVMKKGDTITSTEFKVTGDYFEVSNYGDSMTVTPTEVDDRYVVAKGEELYDNSGSGDKVIIYFGSTGDVASLEFKVSSAQKDMNLGYNTDEIEEITAAYPKYDFEFLRFNTYQNANANVLTNTGTLTFNAIGGSKTRVYEWDGKTLTEKNSKFNSYDDTVTVEGIKRLTCYVIADDQLEAVVEETEAPPATETDAPVTEPVTPPTTTPEPDNNQNPNTGAL